jgi:hypothetical protein
VPEFSTQYLRAIKQLPGTVDIHAGYFHETPLGAEALHFGKLGEGIPGRHIGYRPVSQSGQLIKKFFDIVILKFFGLLVPRRGFADIPQVGVGWYGPDGIRKGRDGFGGDTFVVTGLNKNPVKKLRFEDPQ